MEFLYSITVYKCGVYNIPEKLQMLTTFSTYYGTDLVFPVTIYCIFTLYNVCSVHQGDTMSTLGRYHEYIGGCSVHWGIS